MSFESADLRLRGKVPMNSCYEKSLDKVFILRYPGALPRITPATVVCCSNSCDSADSTPIGREAAATFCAPYSLRTLPYTMDNHVKGPAVAVAYCSRTYKFYCMASRYICNTTAQFLIRIAFTPVITFIFVSFFRCKRC